MERDFTDTKNLSALPTCRQGFGFVSFKVYDVLGEEIVTIVNEEKSVGSYKVEFYGTGTVSGIYFYKLQIGDLRRQMDQD